jgi:hypothetical protein
MKELLSNPIVHGVLVFAIAFLVVKLFSKSDTRIESRRRKAIDLAAALKTNGMTFVPDLLISYAVGDYDDIALKLGHIGLTIHNDPNLKAEFDKVFSKLLASKFQDADAKAELEKMLEDQGHVLTPIAATPDTPDLLDALEQRIMAAIAAKAAPTEAPKV